MAEDRGSISFFATYRPPVALEIYSTPYRVGSSSGQNERCITDGEFYNYNGKAIRKADLKKMLEHPKMATESGAKPDDVDSGRVTGGLVFVSERTDGLETLHIAVRFNDNTVKVVNFAEVYGTCKEARLEDCGCISGDYIYYVSTKYDPGQPHQPWNSVFQTQLSTGKTQRLTPPGQADFSLSISPDGSKLAVASLEKKAGGWCVEIEDLETNIFVIDLDVPLERDLVVTDGGWPTWGSNDVLFFHRNIEKVKMQKSWGVFRINVDEGTKSVIRVTPENISAVTPAAIDDTTVAVATMRKSSGFGDQRTIEQYRHIEVFKVPIVRLMIQTWSLLG
ncbi:uncharacterized protein LOC104891942 [Beta vulgaris subsp. vulgaris]|uniref:uncharacterized protein LOC104891942 n=1 Tax=Beta vulgaris subsp. vulgaris TaxID=3555 RepID=UPI002036B7A4|nr:uncharacterized protein LOC104891942 [Beta vulgaris subsp. vulgaris]